MPGFDFTPRKRSAFAFVLLVLLPALAPALKSEESRPALAPSGAVRAAPPALFDRVAALNRVQEPELDLAKVRQQFDALMLKAREAVAAAVTPREKIAALNKVLLADRKVEYLSNKYWRDSTLAASVLRGKGNCLATSVLYVLAGKALNLPIRMVLVPRHAFARWDDGEAKINIETTSGGNEVSDAEYFSRWSQPSPDDIEKLGWGKSLDDDGLYAELLLTSSGHRMSENRLDEALALLDEAIALLPGRPDLTLSRCRLLANMTGRRDEARAVVIAMLEDQKKNPLPPTVEGAALCYLAEDAAGSGDHSRERVYLLSAFARAPKTQQMHILSQLAFCLRALKDYRGAVRYMELAVMLDPQNDANLYNLAILQKNDGRLSAALTTIGRARLINPESWNLQILEAGYLVLDGQKELGFEKYRKLEKPRADEDFYNIMQAWFHAAAQEREKFYDLFEHALKSTHSTQIFEWIDQDPDLDRYRGEPEFKALVEKHRARLIRTPQSKE